MTRAPDYLDPVVGWRMWHAVEKGGTASLWSIYRRAAWPAGEPLRAECAKRRIKLPLPGTSSRTRHEAPAQDCECGIYALKQSGIHMLATEDFRMMLRELQAQSKLPVLGRVSLWGEVHEHEHGWRASLAYPERLYVFKSFARGDSRIVRLSGGLERYGVPVEVVSARSGEVFSSLAELVPPILAA